MIGRELRELFRLALPLAAAQAGTQLMTVVDIAVLGRYSARDLAAAGLANAFFFGVTVIGMGAIFGIDPLISQAVGAGEPVRARRALWQGVWFSLAVTAVLTVPLVGAALVIPHVGVAPDIVRPTIEYLLVRTAGVAPFLLFLVIRAYLQALAITRPLLVAMAVANILNFLGDVVLVFGWGPIPPLGAAGAAIATVVCSFLEVLIVVVAVKRVHIDHTENLRRWNAAEIRRLVRIGWPIGLQLGAEVGIFALVGVLAARLGTVQLAAHQVVISIASFTYTFALGVAAAGSVRVGTAVGSREIDATRVAGRVAFIGGGAVMATAALLFAIAPLPLARLVTNQSDVIAVAVPLFAIAAVFQISDGLQAVGSGVLRGAGDTHFAFVANIVGHWLVGVPVALFLGFMRGMGVYGLWWGLCAGLTAVAAMLLYRFERLSSAPIVPVTERHP